LFFGVVVFTLLYVWLLLHRQRQLWLEDRHGDSSLEQAIADRRAEAHRG
jgi:heme exporter protein C